MSRLRHDWLVFLAFLVMLVLHIAPAQGQPMCDRYAAPSGRNGAAGTSAAPLRTAQALVDSLTPGEVGCLESGTYVDRSAEGVRVETPGITLTAAPGAKPVLRGRLWVARGGNNVTISGLKLDGRNPAHSPGPVVNARRVRFLDDDVTNDHTVICFILGSFEYGAAVEPVLEGNRIHDCGQLPPINHDHGIYVEDARGAVIRNNLIYDNADRGIQLFPQSIDSTITGNVIDGNGQGLIFSSEGPRVSSGNRVESNVISNSRVRWNVEAFWGEGEVGSGNVVHHNCLWGGNRAGYYDQNGGLQPPSQGGVGFTAADNVIGEPLFLNRAEGNYSQTPASPCRFVDEELAIGGVTLHAVANVGGATTFTGHVANATSGSVVLQQEVGGGWRRIAKGRLGADGFFTVRAKRGVGGPAKVRAEVPDVGASRPVGVRAPGR